MTEPTSDERKGLLASLTTLASSLVAVAHTRLDLLSADLEEEREHVLSLMVTTLLALFFLGVGVLLAAMLLVVVFWETHRLLVLGSLTGGFFAIGIATWMFTMHKAKIKPRIFTSSLSELLKDREELGS